MAESVTADPELEQELGGESSPEPATSATPADEPDDLSALDVDALLRQAMTPAKDEPAPEDTEEPDSLPDADDAEGEPVGEPSAQQEPPAADTDMAAWVDMARSNTARINEVPGKHRGAVVDAILADQKSSHASELASVRTAAQEAVNEAYRRGIEETRTLIKLEEAVAEIDDLRERDADAFVRWEDQFPDRAAAYRQYKAQRNQPAQVDPQRIERGVAEAMAAQQIERLRAVPGAHEAFLVAVQQQGKSYPSTAAGVAALTADVTDALADAKAAAKLKAEEPARAAAARRQAQAEANRSLPKAPGTGTPAATDLTTTNDVNELLAAGFGFRRR